MNTVKLTQWGNSAGIRIPSELVNQAHAYIGEKFLIRINRTGGFTLTPAEDPRDEWTEAFNKVADSGDNKLLLGDFGSKFDEEDWTW